MLKKNDENSHNESLMSLVFSGEECHKFRQVMQEWKTK